MRYLFARRSQQGFTLVELTVVVLIFFVLGLVFLPLFRRHSCYGRPASCASNQKQIALGFLQYIQDYDETFPPGQSFTSETSASQGGKPEGYPSFAQSWGPNRQLPDGRIVTGLLGPYTKSNQLFLDPDYIEEKQAASPLYFMYNDLVASVHRGVIVAPTQTVLITDAEGRWGNVGHAQTDDAVPVTATFNSRGGCDAGNGASIGKARLRNKGGANFAFTDGHVAWFKGGTEEPIFFRPVPPQAEQAEMRKRSNESDHNPEGECSSVDSTMWEHFS